MKSYLTPLFTVVLATPLFADYPETVNSDSPLVYYRFEEDAGASSLLDSSGNNLAIDNANPVGTTELGVDGAIGKAIKFNADGFLNTPFTLDPTVGDFTIELIMRVDDPDFTNGVVVSNKDGDFGTGRSNIVYNTTRVLTSFSGGVTTTSGYTVTPGQFDHIILTYDKSAADLGDGDTFRFYINGELAGSGTAIPEAANGNWVIGAGKTETGQPFSGLVDELAIYEKRLDDPNGDGDSADSRVAEHFKEYLGETDTLVSFAGSVSYLDSGSDGELTWSVSPALTSLTLDDGSGPVDVLPDVVEGVGSQTVSPTATTTYSLTGVGPLGTESLEVVIVVDEPAVVESFTASPETVAAGGNVTLTWEVTNGTTVEIDQGVGMVDAVTGTAVATITEDTVFTLTATNSQGSVTSQVEVTTLKGLDPGLVAHWKVGEAAGETEGTSLVSELGDEFLGTFVGSPTFDSDDPAPVPGGSSASIAFDGADSYVDILGYNGIEGGNPRTVAFWFKGPESQINANATMVSWGGAATTNRFDTRIQGNVAGVIRTEVSGSGSVGTAVIDDNTWHHCAVVFDPTIGTTVGDILFYIDGVADPLSAVGGTEINTLTSVNVRLGASRSLAARSLTGKLDDIRIYNRALSAEEIVDLIAPNDVPLVITGITQLENGGVELAWSGAPGVYALEYSFDLAEGNWVELSDEEEIENGETSATVIENSIAPTREKVFYRFREAE